MVGSDLSVPPAASFEWKWLIEIFIFETHVTPPAKHGMVSSANCSPADEENNFRPEDQICLEKQVGIQFLSKSDPCHKLTDCCLVDLIDVTLAD